MKGSVTHVVGVGPMDFEDDDGVSVLGKKANSPRGQVLSGRDTNQLPALHVLWIFDVEMEVGPRVGVQGGSKVLDRETGCTRVSNVGRLSSRNFFDLVWIDDLVEDTAI